MEKELREILEGVYEAGEYHKRAKSNNEYKKEDLDQSASKIIKLVWERIEDVKKKSNIHTYAYMQALDDVIKELGGKVGKSTEKCVCNKPKPTPVVDDREYPSPFYKRQRIC